MFSLKEMSSVEHPYRRVLHGHSALRHCACHDLSERVCRRRLAFGKAPVMSTIAAVTLLKEELNAGSWLLLCRRRSMC